MGGSVRGRCIFFLCLCSALDVLPARYEALIGEKVTAEPWKGLSPVSGLTCSADGHGCGDALVCKEGVCTSCISNKDCYDKYACLENPINTGAKMCVPRDFVAHWSKFDMVCTVLIVITAMLSAAAGLGGGGVYVPLTILFIGFKTSEAVPLSQAMVLAGAIVNVSMLMNDRHPKHPERPKIAYDVVMLLNPGLAGGVIIGVLAHLASPAWLTLVCLMLTLFMAFEKSWTRGVRLYKKETEDQLAATQSGGAGSGNAGTGSGAGAGVSVKQLIQAEEARKSPESNGEMIKTMTQVSIIFLCWVSFLMINVISPERCSQGHFVQLAATLLVAAVFTVIGAKANHLHNDSLDMEGGQGMKYCALAVLAGFLGGFLGIGGGLVMGPVLLELGLIPEVSQATTAMFVLLSSSLGTMQFMILGKEMPYFVMWYAFWVAVSTVVGQLLSDWVVRVYKRVSFIVFAVSAVVLASAVMMIWVGTTDVMENWSTGQHMSINLAGICGGH